MRRSRLDLQGFGLRRLEKGKPVARRGRKTIGPTVSVIWAAGLPGTAASYLPFFKSRVFGCLAGRGGFMDSRKTVQGHFKYAHFEVTWTREVPPSGDSVDSITRTYGQGVGYAETMTFENPGAAAEKFLNWTMALSCLTDDQALAYFTSLMKAKDLESAGLWNEVVLAAQEAQSASHTHLDTKYDPERRPSERTEAYQAYLGARSRLVAALAELKIVRFPEQRVPAPVPVAATQGPLSDL